MMLPFDALVWLGGLWLGVGVSATLLLLDWLGVGKREVSFPQIRNGRGAARRDDWGEGRTHRASDLRDTITLLDTHPLRLHLVETLWVLRVAKVVISTIPLILVVVLVIIRHGIVHHRVRFNAIWVAFSHLAVVWMSWLRLPHEFFFPDLLQLVNLLILVAVNTEDTSQVLYHIFDYSCLKLSGLINHVHFLNLIIIEFAYLYFHHCE
jgi:hypothetical protein